MTVVMRSSGVILLLLSAACFGAMGVTGTLAYEQGATVGTLLTTRFVVAAAVWWAVVLASRTSRAELRSISRGDAVLAFALGAVGYAGQAGGYFAALERLEPSLLALIVFTYPAMVAVAAVVIGRERLEARRVIALGLAFAGLVLVVSGAQTGALEPVGVGLGLATAAIYSVYILSSERVSTRLSPGVLATLVCTGAAVSLLPATALLGQLRPGDVTAEGWGWLVTIALASTVLAVSLFFAGLRRVGPTTASILSTSEPFVTVGLAALVLGDALTGAQLAGGLLMLAGVLAVTVRPRARRTVLTRRLAASRAALASASEAR